MASATGWDTLICGRIENAAADSLKAGQVGFYQVGPHQVRPGPDAQRLMASLIESKKALFPEQLRDEFYVEIRADRRLHFEQVVPALRAASDAKVEKMSITALLDLGED